jgi:hypothetical protein
MAQPIWITPPGNLGTIPEGVFYEIPLQAYSPDNEPLYYEVIAGQLPAGIQVTTNTGLMTGVPQAVAVIEGVPTLVSRDVTSKFAVRVYTKNIAGGVARLADRTFEITVSSQSIPEFITPPGNISTYWDGSLVTDLQVNYYDPDTAAKVVVKLAGGSLPPGLSISPSGLISGFIDPNTNAGVIAGFSRDDQGYDQYSFDFSTKSSTVNYPFILEVTDGRNSSVRSFSILVYSRNSCTADNTQFTADNTFVTADCSPTRVPIILNTQGSIGSVRNDNFFAYRFNGLDLDGDQFQYIITGGDSPSWLTLDPNSGWLYGYIPNLGITEESYSFNIKVFKVNNPDIISPAYVYTLTVMGNLSNDVTWLTASDLGYIDNGATSTLYVAATNTSSIPLQYRLSSGSNSNLPQGLQLLTEGDIAGRVSFDTFALDNGATTFDVTSRNIVNPNVTTSGFITETTFDMKHTFTVNAYSVNGVVNVYKTFYITVRRRYNVPYDNLYIQAMPPQNDRNLLSSLLQNNDIFPSNLLYRPQDPNFGLSNKVVYWHAYGLDPDVLDTYVQALDLNHYWKNLVLGSIKTAQALDANGNIIYEVVYSEIIDDLVNNQNKSVGKEVTLAYPITVDSLSTQTVYPNSLNNMRTQVIDVVGQISNVLPQWMISKQANGQTLGFTRAWVICYTKPGCSGQVKYNIQSIFGDQLNLVDFEVDRYELDNLLTKFWDRETQQWIPTPPTATTFDINNHYEVPGLDYSTQVFWGGTGYAVGNRIRILGTQLGGQDGLNDVIIIVNTVDALGTIESVFATGLAPLLSAGQSYNEVVGTNITGTGTGAKWDILVVPGTATVFDYDSLKFSAPSDMYSNTQIYDKYLVFPKRNILE